MLNRFPDKARPLAILVPVTVALLLLGAGHALADGYGSSHSFSDSLVEWVGLGDVDEENVSLFFAVLFVFAGFFGYFSDEALKQRGFGIALNGIIGVAGICIALHFALPRLPLLRTLSENARFGMALVIGGAGAPLLLVAVTLLKNYLRRTINNYLAWVGTPPRPQPKQTEPHLDPRVAAALRKKV
ncbi:hypothetical protein [Rhodoblastus sp.]|uniref:hypothetical protein n=1 Tax=Rhodoblastus sp. TaxID=1962975 RepID=UPI003F9BB083